MTTALDPEKVKEISEPIYDSLCKQHAELTREHGFSFAAVVMMDACSLALARALVAFNADARREALQIVIEEAEAEADSQRQQVDAYRAGYEAGLREGSE